MLWGCGRERYHVYDGIIYYLQQKRPRHPNAVSGNGHPDDVTSHGTCEQPPKPPNYRHETDTNHSGINRWQVAKESIVRMISV